MIRRFDWGFWALIVFTITVAFFANANAQTGVYYSIGATGSVLTGSPTVTVSNDTATFSVAQTQDRFGVGVEIDYDATNEVMYIKRKISSTVWLVHADDGTNPTSATDATVNSALHAFNTMAAWETGFTTLLGTTDLTAADVIAYGPYYLKSGGAHTQTIFLGQTTDSTRYIHIYAPYDTDNEVNLRQRHQGVFSTSHTYLSVTTGVMIEQRTPHVWIDGLQFRYTAVASATQMITMASGLQQGWFRLSNCIMHGDGSGTQQRAVYPQSSVTVAHSFYIWNNAMYGYGANSNSQVMLLFDPGCTYWLYNNTIGDCRTGIQGSGTNTIKAINNIVIGSSLFSFATVASFDSANSWGNASNDGLAPGSDTVLLSTNLETDYFTSAVDYHLLTAGTNNVDEILKMGRDNSADPRNPFSDDFEGDERPGNFWDIGADQETQCTALYDSTYRDTSYVDSLCVAPAGSIQVTRVDTLVEDSIWCTDTTLAWRVTARSVTINVPDLAGYCETATQGDIYFRKQYLNKPYKKNVYKQPAYKGKDEDF